MQFAAVVFAILSCVVQSVKLECVVRFSETASGVGVPRRTFDNSSYCEYLGIRYGISRRFQPPELFRPQGQQDFSAQGSVCPQLDDINYPTKVLGDEDCLFLNVFSPKGASGYPVMIFIHGGSFTIGSAGYDVRGVDLLIENAIIIVTINYRLDVLGFLRYPKFNISGNYGLLDQHIALRWIREYIDRFGGNPNRVTLMGHSAGASSINYHMYSDQSVGLFQQAILLSGTFLMPHSFIYEPEKYAEFYFRQMGIATRDELINRDFRDYFFLNDTSRMLGTVFASMQFPCFQPTVDGQFVRDSPHELILRQSARSDIPLMLGTTSAEFLPLLDYAKDYFNWDVNFPNRDDETLLKNIEKMLHLAADDMTDSGLISEKKEFFRSLANYANMVFPMDDLVEKMMFENRVSPIYRYQFEFDGRFGWYKNVFYRSRINTSQPGAMHGDDLGYIFTPYNVEEALKHPEDYRVEWIVHTNMVKAVSNFVKHGNPSSDTLKWSAVNSSKEIATVDIGETHSGTSKDTFILMRNYWKRIHDCYYYYNCSDLDLLHIASNHYSPSVEINVK